MRIRVRYIAELEIDPDAWYDAALEEEWIQPGEVDPSDHAEIAEHALSYLGAADYLPRWARDAMECTGEVIKVADPLPADSACICGGQW